MNLWQITKESQIEDVLNKNQNKLILVYFSYYDKELKSFMKHKLANIYKDCLFYVAFVDKPNETKHKFISDNGKYISMLNGKQLPFVFFLYNNQCIAHIDLAENNIVIKTLEDIRKLISTTNSEKKIEKNTNIIASQEQAINLPPIITNLIGETDRIPDYKADLENQLDKILNKNVDNPELDELRRLEDLCNNS
jgi:hypothetical protein